MDNFVIIIVIIGALFFLFKSNFGKNPSNKTDKQLWILLHLHDKIVMANLDIRGNPKRLEKAMADRAKVEDELKRRGLV